MTSFHSASGTVYSDRRYRYNGKERDEETGLYYYGARYYAAWLGRWTAVDPVGLKDGPNVYAYARNAPIQRTDPTGTQSTQASMPEENMSVNVQDTNLRSSAEDLAEAQRHEQEVLALRALKEGKAAIPQPTPTTTEKFVAAVGARLKHTETAEYKADLLSAQARASQESEYRKEREADIALQKELPSTGLSVVPVVGSASSSSVYFKHGRYGGGIFFGVLAVSDVFLVKSLAVGTARLGARVLFGDVLAGVERAAAADLAQNITRATVEDVAKSVGGAKQGFTAIEERTAEFLRGLGQDVHHNPLEGVEGAGRQGDAVVDDVVTEFKQVTLEEGKPPPTPNTIRNQVSNSAKGGGQAHSYVIDARDSGLSFADANKGISKALGLGVGAFKIVVIGDGYYIERFWR